MKPDAMNTSGRAEVRLSGWDGGGSGAGAAGTGKRVIPLTGRMAGANFGGTSAVISVRGFPNRQHCHRV